MTDVPAYRPLPWPGLPDYSDEERIVRARAFYERARSRRTCRFFSSDPVPREAIEYAVLAAGTAPFDDPGAPLVVQVALAMGEAVLLEL